MRASPLRPGAGVTLGRVVVGVGVGVGLACLVVLMAAPHLLVPPVAAAVQVAVVAGPCRQ